METTQPTKTRQLALAILKDLLSALPALTADVYYAKLRDSGFTESQAVKMCGACIRTASANGWTVKTNLCVNSRKNHSNLQKVWKSCLFKDGTDAKAALAEWSGRGFPVPMGELTLWNQMAAQRSKQECRNVSV